MRVLFSCRPGFGHYHPMVALASALGDAGHRVQFAAQPDLVPAIREDGFDAVPAGLDRAEHAAQRALHAPELDTAPPERMRELIFPASFAGFEVPPRLHDLRAVVREWEPDLMVHDMAEFAAPLVAALEGVPCVNHSWGPLIAADVMAAAGDAASIHWRAAGLDAPDRGAMYDGLYLDVYPPSLQGPHLATVARVQRLRPEPVSSRSSGGTDWLDALGGRPMVLVTFGTVYNQRADLLAVIIEALAERDVDVVVALGPQLDPALLGSLPSNTQVHAWVPWARALAAADLVITHGGANSTLGPLAYGIPLVVIPLAADHFVNADAVRGSGAAVILDRANLNPAAVEEAVTVALSDDARAAASRLSAEIAEAPAAPSVIPVLEAFARE